MEIDVRKLYICHKGQTGMMLCPLIGEECDEKENCNLRPVVNYSDYEDLYKQLQQLKAENEGLKSLNDFNVQKIETLEAENNELKNKDTVTGLRIELDKQKTRLKGHIAKLEQENEELKSKLALFSDVDYVYESTNLKYDLMENDSKKLYLTDEQVDNMCRYVVDLCKSKLFVSNKLFREENEKLKQDLQKETDIGHKAICEEMDSFFEVMKLQKVLDEIEGIIKDGDICCNDCKRLTLNIIKQAKEGRKANDENSR